MKKHSAPVKDVNLPLSVDVSKDVGGIRCPHDFVEGDPVPDLGTACTLVKIDSGLRANIEAGPVEIGRLLILSDGDSCLSLIHI